MLLYHFKYELTKEDINWFDEPYKRNKGRETIKCNFRVNRAFKSVNYM